MTKEESKDQAKDFMTDIEMVEVHTRLNREKHPPTQGFRRSLDFFFVFGCLIFVCSIQSYSPINFNFIHLKKSLNSLMRKRKLDWKEN